MMVLVPLMFWVSPADVLRLVFRLALLSLGRGTLEAIQPPALAAPRLSPRAQRLIRTSRISAW
jgi:hypothetical protein